MTGNSIVFFGGFDWHDPRTLPVHHVVRGLAEDYRVLYVDNFGAVRDLRVTDLARALDKLGQKLRRTVPQSFNRKTEFTQGSTEPLIWQPLVIPTPRLPNIIGRINAGLMTRGLTKVMEEYSIKNPIMWTRVGTKLAWDVISSFDYDLLVYQAIDNFPNNPQIPSDLREQHSEYEHRFNKSADLIYASSRQLAQEKGELNPHTYFFPNGVDPRKFIHGRNANSDVADRIEQMCSPVLGFFGTLSPPVDFSLLDYVARNRPDWRLVLIGPVEPVARGASVFRRPNVFAPGAQPHNKLASIARHFDVGIIPYKLDEFTNYTFPSKLAEYLALDLRIVSSKLPELQPYSDLIEFYDTQSGFIHAVEKAWCDRPAPELRRQTLQQLTWTRIIDDMKDTLELHRGGLRSREVE